MNRIISLLITLFLLFTVHWSFPQGIWKTYTRADGLACNEVFCIAQDKVGNMWFGTWGAGLSKLDTNGVWTRFFADSYTVIYDIEIDSLNNVWVALSQRIGVDGVAKIEDSTITFYQPQGETGPDPNVLGLDSLGQIWCGTYQIDTYWFDGVDWHFFWVPGTWDAYDGVTDIKTDRYGKLYFGHPNGVSTKDKFLLNIGAVTDIAFDKQNRLWVGVTDVKSGLWMFDDNNLFRWTKDNGLISPLSQVMDVAIDSSNNIWIANSGTGYPVPEFFGVSKFDGIKFTNFNVEDGLASGYVYDIYVDKKGDIWFATWDGGVSVLHDTVTTSIVPIIFPIQEVQHFTLFQNYPNPFNSSTCLQYNINTPDQVELSIYNLLGKEVRTLVTKYQQPGEYQVEWNGTDNIGKEVTSGIYFAILKSNTINKTIKLILIR